MVTAMCVERSCSRTEPLLSRRPLNSTRTRESLFLEFKGGEWLSRRRRDGSSKSAKDLAVEFRRYVAGFANAVTVILHPDQAHAALLCTYINLCRTGV